MKRVVIPLWRLLLVMVILAGLGIAGVRLALTAVDAYRNELSAELARFLGVPLKIGEVTADFSGLSLDLVLSRVTAFDRVHGGRLWSLRDLRVSFSPWASLRARAPRIAEVTISGANLVFHYDPGRLRLELATAGAVGELPLTGQGRLRLHDSRLTLKTRGRTLQLRRVAGALEHHAGRVRLSLSANLGSTGPGQVELKADLRAPEQALSALRGRFYLHVRGLTPQALGVLLPGLAQVKGRLSARAWGDWSAGAPQRIRVLFRARGLSPGRSLALNLDGYLGWHREAQGWWLGLTLKERGGSPWAIPLERIELRHRVDSWQLGLQGLDLAAVRPWLKKLVPALPYRDVFTALDPSARMETLGLVWTDPDHWQARGQMAHWTSAPWRALPGIRGLNLGFDLGPRGGLLEPSGQGLVLTFPKLFRWPLEFSRFGGRITIRAEAAGGWTLSSPEFWAVNADISTRSRFRLHLPNAGPPGLDLQTSFRDGVGARAARYVPVGGTTPPEVVHWLDRALVSGRVPSGTLLWRGPLDGFPFADGSGLFEVLFGVEDLILDYREGWPRLEQVTAEVRFYQQGLNIGAQDGYLLESHLERMEVRIPDLGHAGLLGIDGRVRGPFRDLFRILRESPLAPDLAHYVDGLEPRGQSRLDLKLQIPLEGQATLGIQGRLHWRDAGLDLPAWGIALNHLAGELRLDHGHLHAKGLRARLWGQALRLDLNTGTTAAGLARVRLQATLNLDTAALSRAFPSPWWGDLSGRTPAGLKVSVILPPGPGQGPEVDYALRSDLKGLEVGLPPPLGKTASTARTLEVQGHLPLAGGVPLKMRYGDIAGRFDLEPGPAGGIRLREADVRCGGQAEGSHPSARLSLHGRLEDLDLDAWWRWYRQRAEDEVRNANAGLGMANRDLGVDLQVRRLQVFGQPLTSAELILERMPQGWDLGLTAKSLEGRVRVPDNPGLEPLILDLKRLWLPAPDWTDSSTDATPTEAPWPDPATLPPLWVDLADLRLGKQSLGQLRLRTQPLAGGLRIERLGLDGGPLHLEVKGTWLGHGTRQVSDLAFHLAGKDFGAVLRGLGIGSVLAGAPLEADGELTWPAPPYLPELRGLAGAVKFKLGKGRLLDVDPGAGRWFGLVNFWAIQRRLTLDFSDLFKAGFGFDSVAGRVTFAHGKARIDDFLLESPAAEIKVTGSADLVEREYDQLMEVIPNLSATLPVAGALAGGPLGAAVMVVADKLLGRQFDRIGQRRYRVTGPWARPKIEPVGAPPPPGKKVAPVDNGTRVLDLE